MRLSSDLLVPSSPRELTRDGDSRPPRPHSYAFDILYVTWFVHVATALISAQFWKLYWVVRPLLSSLLSPPPLGPPRPAPLTLAAPHTKRARKQIPLYATYRLLSFALPYISPSLAALVSGASSSSAGAGAAGADAQGAGAGTEPLSKRQEKLRKRAERGDPRVQMRRG